MDIKNLTAKCVNKFLTDTHPHRKNLNSLTPIDMRSDIYFEIICLHKKL